MDIITKLYNKAGTEYKIVKYGRLFYHIETLKSKKGEQFYESKKLC